MMQSDLEDIERLEKLEEIILELKELVKAGAIIIVEGRKDAGSLRYLGINGDIQFASQQPLLDLTDSLSKTGKEIVILTDWDKKGSLVARKIIKHLSAYGIVPNTKIRLKLRSLSKKRIKDVESLNNYVNKLRYEIHGIMRF
ncbi:MAG: toprim domain-containing protein [Candidatus Methanoperedens sp.]